MKQTTLSFEEENKKIKYKKKRAKALKEQRGRVRSACCALDNAECRLGATLPELAPVTAMPSPAMINGRRNF
jgi:hypothetical protein